MKAHPAAWTTYSAGIALRLASHSSRLKAPAPSAANKRNAHEYIAARSPPFAHQNRPVTPLTAEGGNEPVWDTECAIANGGFAALT